MKNEVSIGTIKERSLRGYESILGICEEVRAVMPKQGWVMGMGFEIKNGAPCITVGHRDFECCKLKLHGHMMVYRNNGYQLRLSCSVVWKPSWLPNGDQILATHKECRLSMIEDDNERMLLNDDSVDVMAGSVSRAVSLFYAHQLSKGSVIPQRNLSGNRVVGW